MRKGNTTGTVLVQARSDRPRKMFEGGENAQRQPTDHLQRLTTSSCHRWCHWALFISSEHFAQGEVRGRMMQSRFFCTHDANRAHVQKCIWKTQLHFGKEYCGLMKLKLICSIPSKTLPTHIRIWWQFHYVVGLCGQCQYWESCYS